MICFTYIHATVADASKEMAAHTIRDNGSMVDDRDSMLVFLDTANISRGASTRSGEKKITIQRSQREHKGVEYDDR